MQDTYIKFESCIAPVQIVIVQDLRNSGLDNKKTSPSSLSERYQ